MLNDEVTSDDIAFVRKGLTSEVVAAVAKICSNADLIYGGKNAGDRHHHRSAGDL